jgi:hypothetical protein
VSDREPGRKDAPFFFFSFAGTRNTLIEAEHLERMPVVGEESSEVLDELSDMCNISTQTGVALSDWCKEIVYPIPKES